MVDDISLEGHGLNSVFGERKWNTQIATPRSTVKAKGNRWGIAEQYAVGVGSITVFRPTIFLFAVSSADSKCYILALECEKRSINISPNMMRVAWQRLEL